eukprot:GHVN01098890.1.p1 GENE.GHVN01098890.1~~GHVN01098890.1.p1  ORF type:complete len:336 (+),score=30.58 GHVN01098890.1:1024-2031(+)
MRRRTRNHVAPLLIDDGTVVSSPQQVCDVFARQYQSVFLPFERSYACEEDLSLLPYARLTCVPPITPDCVISLINSRKPKTGSGPDGIPPFDGKQLAEIIAEPLSTVYNHSLECCEVPIDWKLANVTPLFKNKGPRTIADQYRPLSSCSFFALIIERYIFNHLIRFFESSHLLNMHQHGDRWGVSTLTNLLIALSGALQSRDLGFAHIFVYIDFRKAFDVVPHALLMDKLRLLGVGGSLLWWIANWLAGRKQRVKLQQTYSAWYDVTSSVPQGSVLGPLLFIAYVSDLCDNLSTTALQFLDNLKLLHVLRTAADVDLVQTDLDRITDWCTMAHAS